MQNLSQQAISAALSHDWNKAVTLNENILKENDKDTDALNRLAYALTQLGKIVLAKKIYHRTLTVDRFNHIAQKNLDRLSLIKKTSKYISSQLNKPCFTPDQFIEEPGKTKTISLKNVAPMSILSRLHIGDFVILFPKKYSVEIRDQNKTYIGALPDDVAFRLIRFLKSGNQYQTCIKNIQKNNISVFIREIKRSKKFVHQPTFITLCYEYSQAPIKMNKTKIKEKGEESQVELEE